MKRPVGILMLATALLAGCGGGGGASKSQYVTKANAVCAATRAKSDPLVAQLAQAAAGFPTSVSAQKLAPVVGQLHTIGESYVAQLRKLKEPSSDHASIDSFVSSTQSAVTALGSAAGALSQGNLGQALSLLEQTRPAAQTANAEARDLGLSECAAVLPAA